MQDSKLNLSDIAIPETVEVAIMQWWNSTACIDWRECGYEEAAEHLEIATEAIKVALLSLATNPIYLPREVAQEVAHGYSNQYSGLDIDKVENAFVQFQRMAFLRKPDPVPEEVKALLFVDISTLGGTCKVVNRETANEAIIAAYKLGKEFLALAGETSGEETTNAAD